MLVGDIKVASFSTNQISKNLGAIVVACTNGNHRMDGYDPDNLYRAEGLVTRSHCSRSSLTHCPHLQQTFDSTYSIQNTTVKHCNAKLPQYNSRCLPSALGPLSCWRNS